MKILYDHQIFVAQKFGGISRYFQELIKITNDGCDVTTIDPDLFINKKSANNYTFLAKSSKFLKRKVGIFDNSLELKSLPSEICNIVIQGDFDIFHPTYFDPYFLEICKKPFVLTVYDMIQEIYTEYFHKGDLTSHNKRILCKNANKIIAISEKTKEDLISIFKIPEEKVHCIPLASSFDTVIPKRPDNFTGIENYILFVGNRELYKNFYFPIFALAEILKSDSSLKILCTGHSFSKEEIQFFEDLGIKERLFHIYLRNDNELAWVYNNATLFIFPSLYEGFGFPLLEAFASNCPVISSTGGSLPEVAGNAALYFDPKNFLQIQDAAISVLYNSKIKSELIKKGKERFKLFSWNECRSKTLEVYKNVS